MADYIEKKFLDESGVRIIKDYIDAGDSASSAAASTAESNAKSYTDTQVSNLKNNEIKTNAQAAASALTEAQAKVASVSAADNSVTIAGTTTAPTVGVKISQTAGNNLTLDETGLYVNSEYTIVKDESSSDYAAVYHLTKDGVNIGAAINIPKDMVLKEGRIEGDKLILVLNDANSTEIEINVGSLIEYVTSGSESGDMVVIAIDEITHKVTATITDGTITKAKLEADIQTTLNKADSALQKADIITGETNGAIKVKDTEVSVAGLKSAAYAETTAFDAAGEAAAVYAAIQPISTEELNGIFTTN